MPSRNQSRKNGNAELQLGSQEAHWHSRGYLPHFDRKGSLQSITFRLADSLSQSKLNQLKEIIEALPAEADPEQAKLCKEPEQWPYSSASQGTLFRAQRQDRTRSGPDHSSSAPMGTPSSPVRRSLGGGGGSAPTEPGT